MNKAKPDIRNTRELLAYYRELYGDATMTAPDQPTTPPATPPAEPPKADPPSEKLLTQSEVNRIAAREKDEGKAAALREVQDTLGVDLDTAKSILKEHNERAESQKSEATKAREAADREKAEAEQAKAEAAREVYDARITRAFVAAGLADEAKIQRYSKLVEAEVGASYEDVKKAVDKLKEEEPALFGGKVEDPKGKRTPAPSSDPKGTPPKPKQDEDAFSRGMARAQSHRSAFTARVDSKT